jgi:hypothetical protein
MVTSEVLSGHAKLTFLIFEHKSCQLGGKGCCKVSGSKNVRSIRSVAQPSSDAASLANLLLKAANTRTDAAAASEFVPLELTAIECSGKQGLKVKLNGAEVPQHSAFSVQRARKRTARYPSDGRNRIALEGW